MVLRLATLLAMSLGAGDLIMGERRDFGMHPPVYLH
jgi:hypothetical protein